MKIGVTADTHSLEVPQALIKDFQSMDLIIHAGDFCSVSDYMLFDGLGELKAVHGNMDESDLVDRLPRKDIFEIEGYKFGLFHGAGSPQKNLEIVQSEFDFLPCQYKTTVLRLGYVSHHE